PPRLDPGRTLGWTGGRGGPGAGTPGTGRPAVPAPASRPWHGGRSRVRLARCRLGCRRTCPSPVRWPPRPRRPAPPPPLRAPRPPRLAGHPFRTAAGALRNDSALGLRHHLLGHHQDVAVLEGEPRTDDGLAQDRRQVGPGAHLLDARDGQDLDLHGLIRPWPG